MKTRFAPSPTGYIHMGNARTALFSYLAAQASGGQFVLRIEDTDAERSREAYVDALKEDLLWLGLSWQEGPDHDAGNGPYWQSQRHAIYAKYYQQLEDMGLVYPCFCTPVELEVMRKMQAQAGLPPRYDGRHANLTPEQIAERKAAGQTFTLRFRVPKGEEVIFDDMVKGKQRFKTDDIGDFIIARADGSPAFFFCNAIDDALMGITHVLRGEDHLANTPRQILMLKALGLPIPNYGHINLILGTDGAPLSKRNGSRNIRQMQAEGFRPDAVLNYMARLGHYYENPTYMTTEALGAEFKIENCGSSPARFDEAQLHYWQKEAVSRMSNEDWWQWIGETTQALVPSEQRELFIEAIRPNTTFPQDARMWAEIIFGELTLPADVEQAVAATGGAFLQAIEQSVNLGYTDMIEAVKSASGAKGKGLFMPLRLLMTGRHDGPELAKLWQLLGPTRLLARLGQVMAVCEG
jgi:glutamyl-tRNA synthetase